MAVNISQLQPGKIVRADNFPNKNGEDPENRRVFVVIVHAGLNDQHIVAAGITTKQRGEVDPNCIEIDGRHDGTSATGLVRASLIVCDWTHKVPLADICSIVGKCPSLKCDAVIRKVQECAGKKVARRLDEAHNAVVPTTTACTAPTVTANPGTAPSTVAARRSDTPRL